MKKENTIISEVLATCADRGKVYGPPHKDYERTAALWSTFLGVPITAAQATACMMLVKLSRLAETPDHRDSLLDVAGYAHCYEDCINNAPTLITDEAFAVAIGQSVAEGDAMGVVARLSPHLKRF